MTESGETEPKRVGEGAVVFVCAAMLIDTISFGLLIPVLPQLLVELTGQTVSQSAQTAGWLTVLFSGLVFLCGPLIGNLSDAYGRRPVLLASMAMFAVNYALMGAAHSLIFLFIGRALTGISGATYGPCNAYVADITPPERRAQRFALIGAAFGAGFVLGPALGALVGQFGARVPFYVAAAMAGVNFLFGWFVLPESLPKERRRPFDIRRANPLGTLMALRKRGDVIAIVCCIFLWNFAFQVYPTTWSFFTMLQLNWGVAAIGFSLAYSGILMVLIQGGLTGRIVRAIGERRAAIVGLSSGICGMILAAFSGQGWMLYLASTIGGLQGLSGASMNALISQRTPPDQQGELQGGVASLNGLGAIFGPLLLSQTISYFTGPRGPFYFPGAAFALSATIASCGLILFVLTTRRLTAPAPHTA